MSTLKNLAGYDKKKLTITNWAGTGTNRVGVLLYFSVAGKESVRLDIQLDLNNPAKLDGIITLSEGQLRHLEPDGDGYTISFTDYNDPA